MNNFILVEAPRGPGLIHFKSPTEPLTFCGRRVTSDWIERSYPYRFKLECQLCARTAQTLSIPIDKGRE